MEEDRLGTGGKNLAVHLEFSFLNINPHFLDFNNFKDVLMGKVRLYGLCVVLCTFRGFCFLLLCHCFCYDRKGGKLVRYLFLIVG